MALATQYYQNAEIRTPQPGGPADYNVFSSAGSVNGISSATFRFAFSATASGLKYDLPTKLRVAQHFFAANAVAVIVATDAATWANTLLDVEVLPSTAAKTGFKYLFSRVDVVDAQFDAVVHTDGSPVRGDATWETTTETYVPCLDHYAVADRLQIHVIAVASTFINLEFPQLLKASVAVSSRE